MRKVTTDEPITSTPFEQPFDEKTRLIRVLLDALPCVALVLRPDREIALSNEAGKDAGALPGTKCYATWGQREERCPWCLAPEALKTSKAQHLEVEALGVVWDAHWIPLGPDMYLHYAFDITESRRAEEELRRAHEDLKRAYANLARAQTTALASEKLAAIGRLTAGVSHEILNPLNTITLSLHLLLDNADVPPDVSEDLKVIKDQTRRITKISQDLLFFSRQRPPQHTLVNVNETVARTIDLLAYELRLDDIKVELKLAEGLPNVEADRDQLQQVILNLVSNAMHSMPKGGRLTVTTARGPQLRRSEEFSLELRVEDTGCGIPPEHLDKIFEPFFTTKPEGEGTGMGLSICHGIVESHGGTIRAENALGGGTSFVMHLPLGEAGQSA